MKIIVKKVYYCEFCKKKSLRPDVIRKHEKHCTKNIDRECGVCKTLELLESDKCNLKKLVEKYTKEKETSMNGEKQFDGGEILKETNGCPACSLSVVRICELNKFPNYVNNFDFKDEMNKIWSDINAENNKEEYYS